MSLTEADRMELDSTSSSARKWDFLHTVESGLEEHFAEEHLG